ncbi:ankyrin repeat-containing domain protein [Biscogniauxia marginata]|nr:ankyrin repeat-containing domain protein [Biscogniauxia marginata]
MDTDNTCSLVEAASAGRLGKLEELLATESSPTEEAVQSLLAAAAWNSQLSTVNLLLSKYPAIPIDEETIRAAIYSGSVELFSALLSRGPSIVKRQFDRRGTPIAVACMSKQPVSFLEFLLKAGADPNQDPDTAPFPMASVAAFYEDTAAAELLLKYNAKLVHSGALAAAAGRGNEVMVRYLIEQGARLETDCTEVGKQETAVEVAARKGHAGVVKILLEHTQEARGKTATV